GCGVRAGGRRAVCLRAVLWAAGCEIAPARVNRECAWTNDPSTARDENHLAVDATVAEDLAIRYADARRGFGSGHYVDQRTYAAAREERLTATIGTIAAPHGVDP